MTVLLAGGIHNFEARLWHDSLGAVRTDSRCRDIFALFDREAGVGREEATQLADNPQGVQLAEGFRSGDSACRRWLVKRHDLFIGRGRDGTCGALYALGFGIKGFRVGAYEFADTLTLGHFLTELKVVACLDFAGLALVLFLSFRHVAFPATGKGIQCNVGQRTHSTANGEVVHQGVFDDFLIRVVPALNHVLENGGTDFLPAFFSGGNASRFKQIDEVVFLAL